MNYNRFASNSLLRPQVSSIWILNASIVTRNPMKSDLLCEDDHDYRLRVETVVSAEKVVMNQQPESFNYSIVSGSTHDPR